MQLLSILQSVHASGNTAFAFRVVAGHHLNAAISYAVERLCSGAAPATVAAELDVAINITIAEHKLQYADFLDQYRESINFIAPFKYVSADGVTTEDMMRSYDPWGW